MHRGQGIGEGRTLLAAPGGDGQAGTLAQTCGQQCDNREHPQQARRGAGDGLIGPLALGFDAQMIARLAERQLQRPAPDEPTDDVVWITVGIGAQQRWGSKSPSGSRSNIQRIEAEGIDVPSGVCRTRQHRPPGEVPHGTVRADLQLTFGVAIPARDRDGLPCGAGILQSLGHRWQAGALLARPPFGTRLARCGGLIQGGIQAQAGDADQTLAHQRGQQIEHGKLLSPTSTIIRFGSQRRACKAT
jgi:hypothetical protein